MRPSRSAGRTRRGLDLSLGQAKHPRRRKTILVTGLPGSGKTALVSGQHFPSSSAVAVTFSDIMRELLAERHPGKNLQELWPQERSQVQIEAAERIAVREPEKTLVIDGHLVVPTRKGWESGVPHAVWDLLRLVAIVVVFVPIEELTAQAPAMLGSTSGYVKEELQVAQSYVHATAAHYASGLGVHSGSSTEATLAGCAFKCITNAQDRWDDAQRELSEYVKLFV